MLEFPEITIAALDPSTDITGAALVRFSGKGIPTVLSVGKFKGEAKGTDLRARMERIRSIKLPFIAWFTSLPACVDLIAYEVAFWRGQAASEAIPMATGAYLSIKPLAGLEIIPVHGATVKAAYGNTLSGGKREDLKQNCIVWANDQFHLGLSLDLDDGDDAIADACAVAVGAWRLWAQKYARAEREKAAREARNARRRELRVTKKGK